MPAYKFKIWKIMDHKWKQLILVVNFLFGLRVNGILNKTFILYSHPSFICSAFLWRTGGKNLKKARMNFMTTWDYPFIMSSRDFLVSTFRHENCNSLATKENYCNSILSLSSLLVPGNFYTFLNPVILTYSPSCLRSKGGHANFFS